MPNSRPEKLPVVSVSIGEEELRSLPIANLQGHYSAWSYFEAIQTQENARFLRAFQNTEPIAWPAMSSPPLISA